MAPNFAFFADPESEREQSDREDVPVVSGISTARCGGLSFAKKYRWMTTTYLRPPFPNGAPNLPR